LGALWLLRRGLRCRNCHTKDLWALENREVYFIN